MSETVRLSTSEGVATVTLDRPERLNAITEQLLDELLATLEAVAGDESDARSRPHRQRPRVLRRR